MRLIPTVLAVSAGALLLGSALSQRPDAPGGGPFGPLRMGDKVTLREKQGRYEFSLVPDAGSHRIVELAKDYIAVEDIFGNSRLWIPITSVQSVYKSKLLR